MISTLSNQNNDNNSNSNSKNLVAWTISSKNNNDQNNDHNDHNDHNHGEDFNVKDNNNNEDYDIDGIVVRVDQQRMKKLASECTGSEYTRSLGTTKNMSSNRSLSTTTADELTSISSAAFSVVEDNKNNEELRLIANNVKKLSPLSVVEIRLQASSSASNEKDSLNVFNLFFFEPSSLIFRSQVNATPFGVTTDKVPL